MTAIERPARWGTETPSVAEPSTHAELDRLWADPPGLWGQLTGAGGSVVIAAWGMGLMVLFVSIAFASLLLGYFYLRLENPHWPPPGIADPGFTRVLVAAGLVLVSGTVARAGLRRLVAGDQRGFVTGLTGGLIVGVLALAVQIVDLVRLDFGWAAHAYGSIFFTLAGFVVLVGVAAIAIGTRPEEKAADDGSGGDLGAAPDPGHRPGRRCAEGSLKELRLT